MGFKKNISAIISISVLGILGHFLYELTGENKIIGLFFPVSESIWEHLKLVFFPSLIYFLFEYFSSSKMPPNYIPAAIMGILCGMLSVVVLYYTITGVIGRNIDFINILIFFIAVIITVSKRNKIIGYGTEYSKKSTTILLGTAFIFIVVFAFWSFLPPKLSIFIPPIQ